MMNISQEKNVVNIAYLDVELKLYCRWGMVQHLRRYCYEKLNYAITFMCCTTPTIIPFRGSIEIIG